MKNTVGFRSIFIIFQDDKSWKLRGLEIPNPMEPICNFPGNKLGSKHVKASYFPKRI